MNAVITPDRRFSQGILSTGRVFGELAGSRHDFGASYRIT